MSTQRYSVTPHPIETLLTWVKSGEIAIPETMIDNKIPDFDDFLIQRRSLMAARIKEYFDIL